MKMTLAASLLLAAAGPSFAMDAVIPASGRGASPVNAGWAGAVLGLSAEMASQPGLGASLLSADPAAYGRLGQELAIVRQALIQAAAAAERDAVGGLAGLEFTRRLPEALRDDPQAFMALSLPERIALMKGAVEALDREKPGIASRPESEPLLPASLKRRVLSRIRGWVLGAETASQAPGAEWDALEAADRAVAEESRLQQLLEASSPHFGGQVPGTILSFPTALRLSPPGTFSKGPDDRPEVQAPRPLPAPPGSSWSRSLAGAPRALFGRMGPNAQHGVAYVAVLAFAGGAITKVMAWGETMTAGAPAAAKAAAAVHAGGLFMSPLSLLLLQVAVILAAGKLMGKLLSRFGQPAVIGEVIGGLALGPSLLGLLAPGALALLFPPASLINLHFLSQIGLIVFMFVVGMELDISVLRKQGGAAAFISHTSIVAPFVLGSALALALFAGFAPAGVPFLSFALFMGIAMSITAFPVLARILHERGMTRTPLGSMALTCAAVDDISAWTLLAVVIGIVHSGSMMGGMHLLAWVGAYVALMLGLVRPLLKRLLSRQAPEEALTSATTAGAVIMLLLSAMSAEMTGVHALFGAFLAGTIIPRIKGLHERLAERFSGFATDILLPIFFALTGLRTQIGLLDDLQAWGVAAAVLAVAVAGKLGASSLAARFSGFSWRDSLSIGALMNTRGLMELVVLNIGYDLGIISAKLFTILVLMAVLTTCMTGPLLSWFQRKPAGEPVPVA